MSCAPRAANLELSQGLLAVTAVGLYRGSSIDKTHYLINARLRLSTPVTLSLRSLAGSYLLRPKVSLFDLVVDLPLPRVRINIAGASH